MLGVLIRRHEDADTGQRPWRNGRVAIHKPRREASEKTGHLLTF